MKKVYIDIGDIITVSILFWASFVQYNYHYFYKPENMMYNCRYQPQHQRYLLQFSLKSIIALGNRKMTLRELITDKYPRIIRVYIFDKSNKKSKKLFQANWITMLCMNNRCKVRKSSFLLSAGSNIVLGFEKQTRGEQKDVLFMLLGKKYKLSEIKVVFEISTILPFQVEKTGVVVKIKSKYSFHTPVSAYYSCEGE